LGVKKNKSRDKRLQSMRELTATRRIIFPLDVPELSEALDFVKTLKDHVGLFKIGLELFVREGPGAVRAVQEIAPEAGIFLDLKFHDIPATVQGAMRSAVELGAEFVTVHCGGGRAELQGAVKLQNGRTKVLGVTVLTSLSASDFQDVGIDPIYSDPQALVLQRAGLAVKAGCAGIVCSGLEAAMIRETFGPELLIITPGIREAVDKTGDQKRVVTPALAIAGGADYIVVGRPIREAADPVQAARRIAAGVEQGLKEREY